jgi:hypothetical protein
MIKEIPMEASWAREKLAEAQAAILEQKWAVAAAKLDVARLHLEQAALAEGQTLQPRTEAGQALEEKHAAVRGVL